MARRKRNSSILERSDRRIESLQSISVELDFGQGLTIQAYTMTINDLRFKLAAYNTALSSIDKLTDDVKNAEQAVIAMSEKMLLGVASRYGKTSQKYEMAGGARRGNKRRAPDNSKVTNLLATDSVQLSSVNGSINGASGAIAVNYDPIGNSTKLTYTPHPNRLTGSQPLGWEPFYEAPPPLS